MKTFQTIAVGFDGSPDAEMAVRWTFDHAHDNADLVVVIHAAGMLENLHAEFSCDEVPSRLLELAGESGFDEQNLRWIVEEGDACSALLRAAGPPINANLLVLGSRGSGHRAGLVLGSTSLEVVEHATIPVVVVPGSFASLPA